MKRKLEDGNDKIIQSASSTLITSFSSDYLDSSKNSTLSMITKKTRLSNKIGKYIIGKKINDLSIFCVSQYICRKENTNKFYILKVYNM